MDRRGFLGSSLAVIAGGVLTQVKLPELPESTTPLLDAMKSATKVHGDYKWREPSYLQRRFPVKDIPLHCVAGDIILLEREGFPKQEAHGYVQRISNVDRTGDIVLVWGFDKERIDPGLFTHAYLIGSAAPY